MRDLLRAYRALIKVAWSIAITYRVQLVIYMISFIFPLIMMTMWLTVEEQTGPIGGFDRSGFISYYIAAAAVFRFTNASPLYRWDRDIRTGELSMLLLKPIDPFHSYFSSILDRKLFDLVLIVPLVVALMLLLPAVNYPLTLALVLAFVCSMIIAMLLAMLIGCAFGMLSFWTTQSGNFANFWQGIGQFLSGFVVPLALFPGGLRDVAHLLPFRSMVSLPVEILMGSLSWGEIGFGLMIGLLWVLIVTIIYRTLWRRGIRRYEAVGA